jgi:nucleotide-binding universal stress UspA family protein
LQVNLERIETTASTGQAILRRAAEINADVVAAGGYGHSRLREWVLGGTTRELFSSTALPVCFSH